MAKIRLRLGENEVEIESRDFYVDNDTASQIISELAKNLENRARIITDEEISLGPPRQIRETYEANLDYLKMLKDAEVHEPEFSPPVSITFDELQSKIEMLENESFFEYPRTVTETVEQLREHGWLASPLDVSKTLAKMAFRKELTKDSQEKRSYYFKNQLTV
jgi:hypothetical protein